jgi:hypothetical protein
MRLAIASLPCPAGAAALEPEVRDWLEQLPSAVRPRGPSTSTCWPASCRCWVSRTPGSWTAGFDSCGSACNAARPLYVTAAGLGSRRAAAIVAAMAGTYRLPDALRRVDTIARTCQPSR